MIVTVFQVAYSVFFNAKLVFIAKMFLFQRVLVIHLICLPGIAQHYVIMVHGT